MEQNQFKSDLPENAYRELAPGEEYEPVMPAKQSISEVTPYSVIDGLDYGSDFLCRSSILRTQNRTGFRGRYSDFQLSQLAFRQHLKKKNALGQNIIIQSIGSSSGVIVAGAIFTIPGLYILQAKYPEIQVDFMQIFLSSLLGGFLGILFLIPFRKYFVKDMHGKFPFPEATATTEILITGEKGGAQAGILVTSGLAGGVFEFLFSSMRLWVGKLLLLESSH